MGRLRFDPSISLGTVLTIISLVSALYFTWHKMDLQIQLLDNKTRDLQNELASVKDTLYRTTLVVERLSVQIGHHNNAAIKP